MDYVLLLLLLLWEVHGSIHSLQVLYPTMVSACCKMGQLDANTCMCSTVAKPRIFQLMGLKHLVMPLGVQWACTSTTVGGAWAHALQVPYSQCHIRLLQNVTTGCKLVCARTAVKARIFPLMR